MAGAEAGRRSGGALLAVQGLRIEFHTERGTVTAVDDVGFGLAAGETLAIVGESGCGKTVTALSLLGLLPSRASAVSGSIRFEGRELVGAGERDLRRIRGGGIAMIFQEPMTALNPVLTIGAQLVEVIRRHRGLRGRDARALAADVLARTGIPGAAERLHQYPHELSGGMRQRVLIAMALACDPKILVADEPTTALDVTTQAEVLDQIRRLQQETGMAMLMITHDLGVVAETCERALVMYCGRVVEQAPVRRLFRAPRHPYTAGLLAAMPRLEGPLRAGALDVIHGTVPDLAALPPGCRFADRCPRVQEDCRSLAPALRPDPQADPAGGAAFACHHPVPLPAARSGEAPRE